MNVLKVKILKFKILEFLSYLDNKTEDNYEDNDEYYNKE
jgi:hypothetical protein